MLSMISIMRSIMNAMEESCIIHELHVKEDDKFSIEFNTEYGTFSFDENDIFIVLSFKKGNCYYTMAKFSFIEFSSIPDKEIKKLTPFKKIFVNELIQELEKQFKRNIG